MLKGRENEHSTYIALSIFAIALLIYWLSAYALGRVSSPKMAYFDHLAVAFSRGQLHLENPPATHDLINHDGRWYVPFPPLPALLMLPWAALGGLPAINTVLFSVGMGALNVLLVFLILRAITAVGWGSLRTADNLWLTALFGIGCVHWYMTTLGSVWFVSQICTVTFMALSALVAIRRRSAFWSGLALGLAMWARPNVVLGYPLLLGIALQHQRGAPKHLKYWHMIKWILLSSIPIIGAMCALLVYNLLRFGNALDFGYLAQNVAPNLADDLHTYGQFNLRYIPRNAHAMLLSLPVWDGARYRLVPDGNGMSLFLTTPAIVYLYRARQKCSVVLGAWLAILLLLIPLLTYYNTGWYQFGYRFSLDFMVPVMILLALAAGERTSWLMRALIAVGVLVNLVGVAWFGNPRF